MITKKSVQKIQNQRGMSEFNGGIPPKYNLIEHDGETWVLLKTGQ